MLSTLARGRLQGYRSDTPLFHVRFEFSCFTTVASCAQVFICSRDFVTLVFLAGGLFL